MPDVVRFWIVPAKAGSIRGVLARRWGFSLSLSRPLIRVIAFAVAIRLVTAALAFMTNVVFPDAQREQFTVYRTTNVFWDTFARYDSGWYLGIARNGYRYVEGGRNNLAFFPMYPLAMRYVGELFGGRTEHFYQAGILVSWTAFVVAMVLLYKLARLDLDEEGAERAVWYAGVFPFAFFYGVVYSESLFLMFMLAAMLGFRQGRWWLAGVAGALAVTTRVNGIMAAPAFAYIAWRVVRERGYARRDLLAAGAALTAVALGLGAYCYYIYTLSGSPFEWIESIRRWNYNPGGAPWTPLILFGQALVTRPFQYLSTEPMAPYDTLNALAAILMVVTIPFIGLRLGLGYALFMLFNIALPLSSHSLEGLGRYCTVLFPLYIWLASFKPAIVLSSTLMIFSMLYVLCLALFTNIHPLF